MTQKEIGTKAGEVWQYLNKNDRTSLTDLPKKVKGNTHLVHLAVGWLARENKLDFSNEHGTPYITLAGNERKTDVNPAVR